MAGKTPVSNSLKANRMQRAFAEAFCDPEVLTLTEAARRAGYKDPRRYGSDLFKHPKVQAEIQRILTATRLTPTYADLKLAHQLEATETKFFAHEGEVKDARDVINWTARADALEKLLKLQGRLKPTPIDVHVTVTMVEALRQLARPALVGTNGSTTNGSLH